VARNHMVAVVVYRIQPWNAVQTTQSTVSRVLLFPPSCTRPSTHMW